MTDERIKELALKCGFTLLPTADNAMDLRPYVYEFAMALIAEERKACAKRAENYILAQYGNHYGIASAVREMQAREEVQNASS